MDSKKVDMNEPEFRRNRGMKEPTWMDYIIHKMLWPLRVSWQGYFFFFGAGCIIFGLVLQMSWWLGLLGAFILIFPLSYEFIKYDFVARARKKKYGCAECWDWNPQVCGINCPHSFEQMQKTNGSTQDE